MQTAEHRAVAAILAGGRGLRMGGHKHAVALAGRPLISYPLAAALGAGLETLVVAKADAAEEVCADIDNDRLVAGWELVLEPEEPRHPLCGLVAALEHAQGGAVVAVGCDMPFLTASLMAWLAGLDGGAVAWVQGRPEPLLARYLPEHLPALRLARDGERPLSRVALEQAPLELKEAELARFGDPRRLTFNVNDGSDLALAEAWLAADQKPID